MSLDRDKQSVLIKRRQFLWKTGTLALGAGLGSRFTALADAVKPGQPNTTKLGWKISVQLKDVLTMGDLDCRNTVIGEGAADCANCLKELQNLGYRALVTIDFEHDTPKLQEAMAKNIAFIEEQARQILARPARTDTR